MMAPWAKLKTLRTPKSWVPLRRFGTPEAQLVVCATRGRIAAAQRGCERVPDVCVDRHCIGGDDGRRADRTRGARAGTRRFSAGRYSRGRATAASNDAARGV